ncbi:MAG: GTPase HflX [Dehalococcoidia bacterium]|nr:GTPase HflX [Dehalococcoidia bacterium]
MAVDSRGHNGMSTPESMRELGRLVRTAGGRVVGSTIQRREAPDRTTYIGSGKVDEIVESKEATDYNTVIFDDPLSPSQQLNLERVLGVKVLDRSALILDIFASRARTREASLQVELAQHEYLLPRLRGQWQHLERLEGAIGSRGPGETQLETDRRLIGRRIARLKKDIEAVRRHRALQRSRRVRQGMPVVALVGYTNAGKSSLMRALAGAKVLAADAPFATLDPVTRRVGSAEGDAFLLTDTVGFMQKLPTQLISAFRATLEELETADLLLHVVDTTSPAMQAQAESVLETLAALGLEDVPTLTVLNKADGLVLEDGTPVRSEADLPPPPEVSPFGPEEEAVYTSATEGWGVDALRERLMFEFFGSPSVEPALAGRE